MSQDTTNKTPVCHLCGKTIERPERSGGTGYGIDGDGNKVCYACCALQDAAFMADHDRITLYLVGKEVTNWPATLRFPAYVSVKTNGHNMGLTRRDAYFKTDEGDYWWGVQYGDNTDLVHCRKLKHRPQWWAFDRWEASQ